jgi:hypothetical protein
VPVEALTGMATRTTIPVRVGLTDLSQPRNGADRASRDRG